MTELTIHPDDTIAIEANLPRDLTGASVSFLFGDEETEYTAEIKDETRGDVASPLSQIDPNVGIYEIKWKITYSDGTVEVLPPTGDTLKVKD